MTGGDLVNFVPMWVQSPTWSPWTNWTNWTTNSEIEITYPVTIRPGDVYPLPPGSQPSWKRGVWA